MKILKQLCLFFGLKFLEICAVAGGFCILVLIAMAIEFLTIRFTIVLPGIRIIIYILIFIIIIFFIGMVGYALLEWCKDNWKWAGELIEGVSQDDIGD